MSDKLLEVKNVFFSYNGVPVLENINFLISKGDFTTIIGPNGSGKTTLLKVMAGILTPKKGQVSLFSSDEEDKKHFIGYVPQDTGQNKDFPISVFDVAMMGRINTISKLKGPKNIDKSQVMKALEYLEVDHLKDKRIGNLSGGQRQRVLIARALASEPKILLFDEPASNIDLAGQTTLFKILRELSSELAVIVVSHDLSVVSQYTKSVACVNKTLHYHGKNELSHEGLNLCYGELGHKDCPFELLGHGVPHRVLKPHKDNNDD